MPFDAEMPMTSPRLAASLLAAASNPTMAKALAVYDAAVAGSNEHTLEDAAHLLAAVLRKPKATRAPKVAGPVEAITAALKVVCSIVEARSHYEIGRTALLSLKAGRLEIVGTDLDTDVSAVVHGVDGEDFSAAVDPRRLLKLLKGGKSCRLAYDPHAESVVVTVGETRGLLPSLLAGDFPRLAPMAAPAVALMDAEAFKGALRWVAPAMSEEATRYYLNGFHLHQPQGNPLTLEATDGHRLHVATLEGVAWDGELKGAIIPHKAASWLVSHLPESGDVLAEISATQARFTFGATVLHTKLVDGNFPDVARVVPDLRDETHATLEIEDAKAFATAVAHLASLSPERSRGMTLAVAEGAATGSVRTLEGASTSRTLPAVATGAASLGLNARSLGDMLTEPCTLRIFRESQPLRVDCATPGRLAVLMPFRS